MLRFTFGKLIGRPQKETQPDRVRKALLTCAADGPPEGIRDTKTHTHACKCKTENST